MALTPENTQTLLHLAEVQPENRRVITTALSILSRRTPNLPDASGHLQLRFESDDFEPTVELGQDGEPNIVERRVSKKLAFNLSHKALSISVFHDRVPLEVPEFPGRDLYRYPRIAFVTGTQTEPGEHVAPHFSRIYASDILNRDVVPNTPFTMEEFEAVFYHSAAEHGLYQHIKALHAAPVVSLEGEFASELS